MLWRFASKERTGRLEVASLCLLPCFFGLAATVVQIETVYAATYRGAGGLGPLFEESAYEALYSWHIEMYGTILLAMLSMPLY